jgi:hypothetical protein
MAEGVVQVLETVHVHVHHHRVLPLTTRHPQLLLGERHEAAAVVKPGQVVSTGSFAQAMLFALLRRDVVQGDRNPVGRRGRLMANPARLHDPPIHAHVLCHGAEERHRFDISIEQRLAHGGEVTSNSHADHLSRLTVQQAGAASVGIRDLEVDDLPLAVTHRTEQEHAVHAGLHGVL